jgi:hypothetical protein
MPIKNVALAIICLFWSFSAPVVRSQELPTRFEIGPLFTYLRIPDSPPINAQNQAEIGGRFSWNFARHFALDAEIEASPFRTTNLTTSYQGGHLLQAFGGPKSGKRWNRFGAFGKFRLGLDSYSAVIKGVTSTTPLIFQLGRRTDPSFDVGGILEFYVSRRILVRYDFGDTIIHYNAGAIAPSVVKNNFQFTTAVAFRF